MSKENAMEASSMTLFLEFLCDSAAKAHEAAAPFESQLGRPIVVVVDGHSYHAFCNEVSTRPHRLAAIAVKVMLSGDRSDALPPEKP